MSKLNKILIACGLGLFLALSLSFNVWQGQTTNKYRKSINELEMSLKQLSTQRDSLKVANDSIQAILDKYKYTIDSLDVLVVHNKKQVSWLNKELLKALNEIDNLSGDDAYDAVNDAYSDWDNIDVSDTYSFDELEIKEIYKDHIRVKYLDSIRNVQAVAIDRMSVQLDLKGEMIKTLAEDNDRKTELLNKMYIDLAQYQVKYEMSEAEVRRLKKTLFLWKAGSITTGAAIVAALILL